jgi:hypothetical protein
MPKIKSHKTVEQIAKKHRLDVSFIQKQLDMGEPIEHEHTKDHDLARNIALQHLDEIPDYYTRLKKMEADAKKNHKKSKDIKEEGLRDWFGKSKSKDGKAGWVNVVTGGTCASDEPGEGTPKCVSSAKRASMSKAERLSASRRKKQADPGQQQKTGAAKPTYVSTDKPEKKMNEAKEKDHEHSMARSELSTVMNAVKRLKKKMGKGEGNIEAWVQSKITKAADYLDSAADYIDSGEHNVDEAKGPCWDGYKQEGMKKKGNKMVPNCVPEETVVEADIKGKGSGKKDACYNKVKSRYSVWPSAYASGALVKCRKVGAANWGNKSEEFSNWRDELGLQEAGDYWHPDPEQDRKLSNRGAKLRSREDQSPTKSSSSSERRLKPGESYMDYSRRVSGQKSKPKPERKRDKIKIALGKAIDRVGGLNKEDVDIQDMYGNTFATIHDVIKADPLVMEKNDDVCEVCGKSPCECSPKRPMGGSSAKPGPDKNYVKPMSESVKIPAKTGNIILVTLNWRGKYFMIKLFFPQTTKPSRQEVQDQIEKVYPGSRVQSYYVSDIKPGEQFLQVEDWQSVNRKDKTDGLSQKAVDAYRRENPGSKLQTAVTEKKPTGKRAERRKSFCRRMTGMKKRLTSAETARDPDSRINKALRRWNCN